MVEWAELRSPRVILRVIECAFSLLVLGLSAAWINAGAWNAWSVNNNVGFALFVGLTCMLLSGALVAASLMGIRREATVLLAEFGITAVWWIFWLAAAAATADSVRGWNEVYGGDWECNRTAAEALSLVQLNQGAYLQYCAGLEEVPVLRACCAFCWLTWFLWSGSLYFCIRQDAMQKGIFSRTDPDTRLPSPPHKATQQWAQNVQAPGDGRNDAPIV